ncbi:membrane protein [Trichophyton mentagrophytes]|nr:membrane protein [Trichophyton mentagrophytes]
MAKPAPKLPVQQFVILAVCRFAEPVVFTSVFPYLPEMVRTFGVVERDVAKWVGILSAIFALCQCITAVPWGNLSDRIGRKPVILTCLSITMFFTLLFGVSTSLPMAVLARACLGFSSGNVGIIRTVVAELVPERELQPRAFSLMPLVWTIGSIFGPAFGGALVNPVKKYPEIFGNSYFFKTYPFALPNILSGGFFIIGIITGFLFLKETLSFKKNERDYGLILGEMLTSMCCHCRRKPVKNPGHGDDESTPLLGDRPIPVSAASKEQKRPKTSAKWTEVLTFQSVIILSIYASLGLHSVAFDSVLPVFLNHPRQKLENNPDVKLPFKFSSGFGIDSQAIGILFTLNGVVGMIVQFFVFPPTAKRFGVLRCFKVSAFMFPVLYFLTPFLALFPTDSTRQLATVILMAIKLSAVVFAFPSSIILLTNSASSVSVLGTLNGVATSASAIGRAIGPAALGGVFSIGVKAGYMIIPWWALAFIAAISALPAFWIVETDGFAGDTGEQDNEDTAVVVGDAEQDSPPLLEVGNVRPENTAGPREVSNSDVKAAGDEPTLPAPSNS